jgi:hypothetical protein
MLQLYTKIKSVKKVSKGVNKEEFGSLQQKVIQARVRLEQASKECDPLQWCCRESENRKGIYG